MNSSIRHESMYKIADVIGDVRKKGVRLWSKDGELHYKAPKGALTQEEIERLRVSRGEIIALLEGISSAENGTRSEPSPRLDRAPLTFSQLQHWYLYKLRERPAIRQIESATRLHGRLDVGALQRSVAEIVRRHDALRTRIVVCDGVPTQEIDASADSDLEIDDLTPFPQSIREAEVNRQIERYILEPIDISVGPLFGIRLLKIRDNEHVLIVAMEHIIADVFSMGILLRDIFAAYVQAVNGHAFSLPPIPFQFADYAVWQRKTHSSWLEKHGAYWDERLVRLKRVRFPVDTRLPPGACMGWGTIPVKIESDIKRELREWCRLKRTTLVMSVFSAYVGLVSRWCNVSEVVIQYVIDGRVNSKVQNAVGTFGSALYLRVEIREGDSCVDLLNRVTEEYCSAFEHADFFYMEAQERRPEFVLNTAFNWSSQGASEIDLSALDGSEYAITCSPVPFTHPMLKGLERDNEPVIELADAADEIIGGVHFPLDRFSIQTMERFGRSFLAFVGALLEHPEQRVMDIMLL